MTEMKTLNRTEFVTRYACTFEKIFAFDVAGECVVKSLMNWEVLSFPELNLTAWSADTTIFQHFLEFIGDVVTPDFLILTEVESIEKFSETQVVRAHRENVEKLWIQSHLPHFKTVCFDESTLWCALFDSRMDKASFYRKKSIVLD
jgi:hypothetical protein